MKAADYFFSHWVCVCVCVKLTALTKLGSSELSLKIHSKSQSLSLTICKEQNCKVRFIYSAFQFHLGAFPWVWCLLQSKVWGYYCANDVHM